MAFTYDLSTTTGQIRLLIFDTNAASYTFQDAEIAAMYSLLSNDLFNTAATLCETQGRAQLPLTIELRQSDGSSVKRRSMSEWLAMAKAIRAAALSGTLQTGTLIISSPNEFLDSFYPDWRNLEDVPIIE